MKHYTIAIDQSTSATKAMLFDEQCKMLARQDIDHRQYYPQEGFVEHDAEEIYQNVVETVRQLMHQSEAPSGEYSLSITNQRETVVVWEKRTGKPITRAVVWQDIRGRDICRQLVSDGMQQMVLEKSGLPIDPNFSACGVKWILDHVDHAREAAEKGDLLMGTIDTWLIWKLTGGKVFATDTTNASRTMLFNIHSMKWDEDLLRLFSIPRSMLAEVLPCDAFYGETTVDGVFRKPIPIAGVLGDSHGAMVAQMCFHEGLGKVTYGTGSSVMANIGEKPKPAPKGLVTSIGFSAFGKHYYGYEGNIYSTGATLKWMADQMQLIDHPRNMEEEAVKVKDNGGVYFVPAFAGLGAPWWEPDARGGIVGMTFATSRAHLIRAGLESIGYQVKDLIDVMTSAIGHPLKEIFADGGPTRNKFLMQFQADLLGTPVVCTEVEDASATGAALMNGFSRKEWTSFDEVVGLRKVSHIYQPHHSPQLQQFYDRWQKAVKAVVQYQ